MPKGDSKKLTATAVEAFARAPRTDKVRRAYDERGLFLEAHPSGAPRWRLKYRYEGKEARLSLGTYPDVSLKDAREKTDEARGLLARGIDPGAQKREAKAGHVVVRAQAKTNKANTFEVVARAWYAHKYSNRSHKDYDATLGRLIKHLFGPLGAREMDSIAHPELLAELEKIAKLGKVETAHRTYRMCQQIWRYAVQRGLATSMKDPTLHLRGALPTKEVEHHASIVDPSELGKLLRAMDTHKGTLAVHTGLVLLPHVFLRPVNVFEAEWAEIDLDKREWVVPKQKLKVKDCDLTIGLSTQVHALLKTLHDHTGGGRYVFPQVAQPTKPISSTAFKVALAQVGYPGSVQTPHGFRATARTLLDEKLGFRFEWVEHQLNHRVRDGNGRAYNRTTFQAERAAMMQRWSDYLDELKAKAPEAGAPPPSAVPMAASAE